MHAPSAFPARPGGGALEMSSEWVAASDWFVIFTLGTLLFLVSAFALWAWLVWRRATHPEPHVRLLMEMAEEDTRARREAHAPARETEQAEPWERPADWWKKSGG